MPTGGVRHLRTVQIGVESTKGTAVPATEMLLADAEANLSYDLFRNEHPFGQLVEHGGPTALLKKDVDIPLRVNGASFEQLPWWLSLAVDQPATAGVGPYVHTWDPGTAALWNPHSATLEAHYSDGSNDEDVEFEYFTGRSLRLSIEQNGQLEATLDGFARQVTDAAITSLSLPTTLTPIRAADGKIYMNDTWAAADAQAPSGGIISNQIISAQLEIMNGQSPFHGIEGQTYFSEAKEREKNIRLTLRCLYNPATGAEGAAAERAHAQAQDLRFVTLAFTGAGNLQFYIAVAGKHEMGDFLSIGEQDGMDVVEMTIVGHYDPTGASLVKAVVQNDDADPL